MNHQDPRPGKILSANALKLLAILAMTVDHLTWVIFPGYPRQTGVLLLHLIGRLTCPIMCFFIAEGYHYTKNFRAYAARLFALAIVSHFAYMFCSCFAAGEYLGARSLVPFASGTILNQTGVVWGLLGGLLMLKVNDMALSEGKKVLLVLGLCLLTLPADWSCIAPLCILSIGANRGDGKTQIRQCFFYVSLYVLVYCVFLDTLYGLLQFGVFLSVPLLRLYSGQRGSSALLNRVMKPLFYIYYPLHLLLIGLARTFFF